MIVRTQRGTGAGRRGTGLGRRRLGCLALGLLAAWMLLAGSLPASATASRFCDALRTELRKGAGKAGLMVTDLASGRQLCASGANRQLILASNTKLFTTAALLGRLGPERRLRTTVWAVGKLNGNGVLRGDLYLRGAGDPALAVPAFSAKYRPRVTTNLLALTAQVRAAGIRRVTGRLYADDTIFDRRRGVADSGYRTSPWIGPLSGLAFNSGYSSNSATYFAADPARLAAERLLRSLRRNGVAIRKAITLAKLPRRGARELVAVVRSPTVALLAQQINVHSDNFFAETMLKTLGALVAKKGSTAAGARVVMQHARSLGSGAQIVDGSGLTRTNTASARQVVQLLTAVAETDYGDDFRRSLPLSSRDGTLAARMHDTAAERRCEAKTGTLTGVSALSGYCETRSGRTIAFSILMNSVSSSTSARYRQDRIAARIAAL